MFLWPVFEVEVVWLCPVIGSARAAVLDHPSMNGVPPETKLQVSPPEQNTGTISVNANSELVDLVLPVLGWIGKLMVKSKL